jgi:C4-dicarboxylate transporter, DctM subunit
MRAQGSDGVALILFGMMFVLITAAIPIAFAIGIATLASLWLYTSVPLLVIPQRILVSLDSYVMLSIPLFVLAGYLMETGGISDRIVRLANSLVGFIRGGLAMVVIVATVIFSGLSGSSVADTAAIGSGMIPTMTRRGYPKAFTTALVAAAGGMGILVPPCILMIIYAMLTETSVAQLFAAGFLPAFLMASCMILLTYTIARRRGFPVEACFSLREVAEAARGAFFPLLMPVIILGGILLGIFTVTESAAVAVVYGFILTVGVYREIRLRDLPGIFVKTATTTGVVALLIAVSTAFGWVMGRERIPHMIAEFIGSISGSDAMFLLAVNILLLVTGTFMDGAAAIILMVPILWPIGAALGINPIHFGIVLTANVGIGMVTPPFGLTLFTACGIGEVGISDIFKDILPFIAVMIAALLLITYWPSMTLFIPRLVF